MNLTLTKRLVLGGALLVSLPLLFIGGYGLSSTTRVLTANAQRELQTKAVDLTKAVHLLIRSELQVPLGLSRTDSIVQTCSTQQRQPLDADELGRFNRQLHNVLTGLGPRYEGLFVIGTDGKIFAGVLQNGDASVYRQLDINDRAYFRAAVSTGRPVVGEPVRSKVGGGAPITVLCIPVLRGEDVVGYVGLSLKIQYIIDWLGTQKTGATGQAYLLNKAGAFIAHPDPARILSVNASGETELQELAEHMTAGETGVQPCDIAGVPCTAGYAPVQELGWSAAVTQHTSEFMAPVQALRLRWSMLGAIALGVSVLITTLCGRALSRPIQTSVDSLYEAADEVSGAAAHVSESSQSVASMATEQAAALEETSSSLEELSSMAKQNADAARQAMTSMTATRQTVIRADASLHKVAAAMETVCAASEESQKIVKTMDEIAFQTNILALNAAVEAARAGVAGAGFAVVAEEVRALASRSAEAARQTANIIEQNIEKIHASDTLVRETATEFADVARTAGEIEKMLSGIATASAEQTQGVEQINLAVSQQDQAVQANAAASEESASASAELTCQADSMREQLTRLTTLVDGSNSKARTTASTPATAPRARRAKSPLLTATAALTVFAFLLLSAPRSVAADVELSSLAERLDRLEAALGLGTSASTADPAVKAALAQNLADLRSRLGEHARAPAPAIQARDRRTMFRIFGYVKLDAIYDSQKTSAGDLMFFVLPRVNGRRDSEFNMTVRETRLGLSFGTADSAGQPQTAGRVEMDFSGGGAPNSLNPRLRLAYFDFKLGSWVLRAGQDWDAFVTVIPRSLNFAVFADQGHLGNRRAQLRATRQLPLSRGNLELRVAAARTIGQDMDGYGQDDGVDAAVPTLQWNALWTASPRFKASVSGHLGRESVEHAVTGLHTDYASWSAIGSVVAILSPRVTLQGTLWQGKNLDCYFGGIGQGINLALRRAIPARGGWVQALLTPTPALTMHATFGVDDPADADLQPDQRSYNRAISSGFWYEFLPSRKIAVEVSYLETGYLGSAAAANLRVQSGLIMDF